MDRTELVSLIHKIVREEIQRAFDEREKATEIPDDLAEELAEIVYDHPNES